jgi:c-di-GMP-binding flagellar brake protein YcgR
MYRETRPVAAQPQHLADAWAEFRVGHPHDCRALLCELRDRGVPLVLSGPDGSAITCSLWTVDDEGLGFGADAGSPQLARLLEADEAVAVAYLDSVKLQFDLQELVLVRGRDATTLRAAPPREIYRFQRRQAYRVRTFEHHTPRAVVRHPALPEMQFMLRVLDVSMGGCGLWQPADVPPFTAGTELVDVEVALDADTRFHVTLRLQHVSALAPRAEGVRLGCEWHLSPSIERSLQRWIDQAQKRRRLGHGHPN